MSSENKRWIDTMRFLQLAEGAYAVEMNRRNAPVVLETYGGNKIYDPSEIKITTDLIEVLSQILESETPTHVNAYVLDPLSAATHNFVSNGSVHLGARLAGPFIDSLAREAGVPVGDRLPPIIDYLVGFGLRKEYGIWYSDYQLATNLSGIGAELRNPVLNFHFSAVPKNIRGF